ncbi:MAG: hypothetical protein KJ069_00230 [Anaerolineae bacterium]|nr:hypothetical protein [Anaerolineae bacterium]
MPTNSVPEGVPFRTYITRNPTGQDPQLLRDATQYHLDWKLDVQQIASFEEIIRDLARRKGEKQRIRIVAHASFDSIQVPFFDGGPEEVWGRDFVNAFARSDVMGLLHVIGDFTITLRGGIALLPALVGELRRTNASVLGPFGLEVSGLPSGAVREFFNRVSQLKALQTMRSGANAGLKNIIDQFIDAIEFVLDARRQDGMRGAVADETGAIADQVRDLQDAIERTAPRDLRLSEITLAQRFPGLRAAFLGITRRRFRDRLMQARGRFSGRSIIDVRGCTVGRDELFLEAISRLFAAELPGPTVTAPTLFQTFGPGTSRRLVTVPEVDAAAGEPGVDSEALHWSTVIGAQNFLTLSREKRLLSYFDKFVLPVGRNPSFFQVGCELFFFGPELSGGGSFLAPNGSSGFLAITDWLLDQWNDFPSQQLQIRVHQAGRQMRQEWIDRNRAPPFSGVTDGSGTVFVVPDPLFRARLGIGKAE